MNNDKQVFYSKVLLFGEFLVVKGSSGLAIPFKYYSGHWRLTIDGKKVATLECLEEFCKYIANSTILSKNIDANAFLKDIESGLYFHSSIPHGRGVGSSGALCAAILNRYGKNLENFSDMSYLKDILSLLESFYHGSSSGIDPLISYVNRPLMIENRNGITLLEEMSGDKLKNFYLLDTKISRKTAPLVDAFLKKCDNASFNVPLHEFMAMNQILISKFLKNENITNEMFQFSQMQLEYLLDFIPAIVVDLWRIGLESSHYAFKLCGAGGGGHLLIYVPDTTDVKNLSFNKELIKI